MGGVHKKMKAHKEVPEYTIIEDDAELVAERVQDHTAKEYEEEKKTKGKNNARADRGQTCIQVDILEKGMK